MKKQHYKNKIISGALTLCLMAGLLPMGGTTAFAADTATSSQPMTMGMSGVKSRDITSDWTDAATVNTEGDKIVMGIYTSGGTEYTVTWVNLGDYDGDHDGTNDGQLMLSEYVLGTSTFSKDSSIVDAYYSDGDSALQAAMKAFYDGTGDLALSAAEKALISETTLTKESVDKIDTASSTALPGQRFFPLSGFGGGTGEYWTYVGHGSELAKPKPIEDGASFSIWWMRTSNGGSAGAGFKVSDAGIAFHSEGVENTHGVRPAFNLNTSSVLFTSAAENGKSVFDRTATSPTLGATSGTAPTTWKMTLLDSARTFALDGTPAVSGNEITFDYTGATTGANEYISVMIVDSSNNITHYAKVEDLSTTADGSASFILPSTFSVGDTVNLKIFNEQANGDNKTDYSSAFKEFTVTISADVTTNLANITSSNTATIHNTANDYTATLIPDTGYMLPQAITVTVDGATLTSSQYTYTQATGALTIPRANITRNIVITAQSEQLKITDGSGQTVTQGQGFSVTSNDNFETFEAVDITLQGQAQSVDLGLTKTETSNANANIKGGSIIATINGSYTATMPLGTHTITIHSGSGAARTQFTIVAPPAPTPTPTPTDPTISPLTGVYSR